MLRQSLSVYPIMIIALLAFALGGFSAPTNATRDKEAKPDKYWVFVGTYTSKESKGIYRLELDMETGKLSEPELAAEVVSPSFLAIHPNRRFLYAVTESSDFGGKKSGAVSAFSLDAKSGELKMLNIQPSKG